MNNRTTGRAAPGLGHVPGLAHQVLLLIGLAALLAGCSGRVGPDVVDDEVRSAQQALTQLEVKGKAPKTGYDRRAKFGAGWLDVDRNGCDTRNDVLARDLLQVSLRRGGCVVLAGVLAQDPYTGREIAFERGQHTSSMVQIDHVVALANAWVTGAQYWTQSRREVFANDPLNLLAVDGPTNQSKGAADAATWLPPRGEERCAYVARQVSVKYAWQLWVAPAERDALQRVLARCPEMPLLRSDLAPARRDVRMGVN